MTDLGRYAPCALVELRTDGSIADANDTLVDWTGIALPDLLGTQLNALIDESRDLPLIADPRDTPTGASGARSLIVQLKHADGGSRPVLISWSRQNDRVFVSIFDATQRQEFEDRMLSSYAFMERNGRRLGLLLASAVSFAEAVSPVEVGRLLADTVRNAYAAAESAVFLVDDDGRFVLAAGVNPFAELPESPDMARRAMDLREVVTVSSVSGSDTLPAPIKEALMAAGIEGLLLAPMFHEAKQHGVFAAFFNAVRPFDEQAVPLAEALGRQAGQVISGLELQQQLQRLALHDPTTGLPNRRMLEERIDAYARKTGVLLAVIFLDVDGFKSVNDRLGHTMGDQLLRMIGERMQSVVRDPDTVARFGGDEFVAVCEVSDAEAARIIAERLREAVSAAYPGLPPELHVGVSVGVAVADGHTTSLVADQLVRVADHAMYAAKTTGGNRVVMQSLRETV